MKQSAGFTLIELLVVIAIIGILASVVLASLSTATESAKYTAAKQEMQLIYGALILTGGSSQPIMSVTGSNCTDCACRTTFGAPVDIRNIPDTDQCLIRWRDAITRIAATTPIIGDVSGLLRDPWGTPYLLDENENEVLTSPCRKDELRTAGADGQWGTADDFIILLPLRGTQCS